LKLKIIYRSAVIWNAILFILFSFIFVYFQDLYINTGSVLNIPMFKAFLLANIPFTILGLFTIYNLYRITNLGVQLYRLSIFIVLVMSIINLTEDFSKLNLMILFFYLSISFYIYQFYTVDKDESYYNPLFSESNLFEPMLKKMNIKLYKGEELIASGQLTNWSSEGCFVRLNEGVNLKGMYSLEIEFEDLLFTQACFIVSKTKNNLNYGFRFKTSKRKEDIDKLDWKNFYEIVDQMGYKPEFLI